jgi:hypothetical protein
LWISIIDHISEEKLKLPVYYSCDWDYHGLRIFKSIREKLRSKSAELSILVPSLENAIPVNSPNHFSEWNLNESLGGLDYESFSQEEIILIKQLVKENKWIEEESLDLFEMVTRNRVKKRSS